MSNSSLMRSEKFVIRSILSPPTQWTLLVATRAYQICSLNYLFPFFWSETDDGKTIDDVAKSNEKIYGEPRQIRCAFEVRKIGKSVA